MRISTLIVLLVPFFGLSQITPEEVIDKAVKYHDPEGMWPSMSKTFEFSETRPSGPDRTSTMILDNSKSYVRIDRNNEEIYEVMGEDAKVLKGDKDSSRGLMMRNYYLYLWGLPMKLKYDKTPFDNEVKEDVVEGVECYIVRVVYEKDTWYFSFEKATGKMIQYSFYKDEEAGKGERITLEGEVSFGSFRIPKKRSWYKLPENEYLGTDILDSIK